MEEVKVATKEEMIRQVLDRLAETEAQIDVLQMQKRELLDAVTIPEEIQALQDEMIQRKRTYEEEYQSIVQALNAERMERVAKVVVPAEVLKIFEQVEAQRKAIEDEIEGRKQEAYQAALTRQQALEAAMGEDVAKVFQEVAQRKSEIEAEFGTQEERAKENVDSLTLKAKKSTEEYGETVKGAYRMAVYTKGRTTWTTDILDGIYFRLNDLLEDLDTASDVWGRVKSVIIDMSKARHVGKPSVSIRKI
jgi:hypothetical protein